jgi:hypothetical protein
MRGVGRALFAATLLLIVGTLNIIYRIGALDDANIFVNDKRYIFTNLNTMGWVLIVLGVIQITGGVSLFAGNSAAPTRGGRWASSSSASGSCTASSSTVTTRERQ